VGMDTQPIGLSAHRRDGRARAVEQARESMALPAAVSDESTFCLQCRRDARHADQVWYAGTPKQVSRLLAAPGNLSYFVGNIRCS
jgi:hypothetical protein